MLNNELFPKDYIYYDWESSNKNWLLSDKKLPNIKEMIEITDSNGDEWLVLEKHISWDEPTPLGQEKYSNPRKHLWYQLRSCFVKENEYNKLLNWSRQQRFMGRWFPESHDQYQVYSREYYWSPAYQFFDNPYYGGYEWEEVYDQINRDKVISKVLPTSEGHIWESGADYEEQPSYLSPREFMFSGMSLQYSNNMGEWLDKNEKIVCLDPSVRHNVSSSLIVKKDIFIKFLSDNDLKILWTCLGEKNILGADYHGSKLPNWMEISGVCTLDYGKVKGDINTYIDGK